MKGRVVCLSSLFLGWSLLKTFKDYCCLQFGKWEVGVGSDLLLVGHRILCYFIWTLEIIRIHSLCVSANLSLQQCYFVLLKLGKRYKHMSAWFDETLFWGFFGFMLNTFEKSLILENIQRVKWLNANNFCSLVLSKGKLDMIILKNQA